ncbi:MAG: YfiR family protein [Cellvibrio sp.]|uniref:YfiR family protein n=1 Tax=Cellvibrio sp. TaxID=1965322 RepID=UPI0027259E3A|nr:YfiR family protein [Cellvibrio sp.]
MSKANLHKPASGSRELLTDHKKLVRLLLLVCIVLSNISSQALASDPPQEYQVKAAMTYKFLGYSEWPPTQFDGPHSPYRIWVLDSTATKNELQRIVAHRIINGRSIEVYSATTVNQIDNAHIVFVARDMEFLLPRLSRRARKNAYLVVTENEHGLVEGSTINLRLVNGRVGFDISLNSAQSCGITLSSSLLSIAVSIEEGQR